MSSLAPPSTVKEEAEAGVEEPPNTVVGGEGPPKAEAGHEGKAGPSVEAIKEEKGGGRLDDSLEEDFKQTKKRFRTPQAAGPVSQAPLPSASH